MILAVRILLVLAYNIYYDHARRIGRIFNGLDHHNIHLSTLYHLVGCVPAWMA